MLQSLEDEDHPNSHSADDHSTIEGTIQITDRIIADKDQLIARLQKQLLEEQASRPVAPVVHAEVAQHLDKDEAVSQERDRLKSLQTEWRENLRQAEIDISLERAKLARERAEIEEKMRLYRDNDETAPNGGSTEKSKPVRGRWLARLGLKDAEE